MAFCLCNPSGSNVIRSNNLNDGCNNAMTNTTNPLSDNMSRLDLPIRKWNEEEDVRIKERESKQLERRKIEESRNKEKIWYERFYHITFPGQVRRPHSEHIHSN